MTSIPLFLLATLGLFHLGLQASTTSELANDEIPLTHLAMVGYETDIKVTATTWESSHGGEGTGKSGRSRLHVIEPLWGFIQPGAELELKWTSYDKVPSLGEDRMHQNGEEGIYFLTCSQDRLTPETNYQCRVELGESLSVSSHKYFPITERDRIVRHLRQHILTIEGKPAFFPGHNVVTELVFVNHSGSPLALPGISHTGNMLLHDPGFSIFLTQECHGTDKIPPRSGSMKVNPDIERIEIEPNSLLSVDLDLSALYGSFDPGFYCINVEINGYDIRFQGGFLWDPGKSIPALPD